MNIEHAKKSIHHWCSLLGTRPVNGTASFDRAFPGLDERATKAKIVELVDRLRGSSSFRTGQTGKDLIAAADEFRRELAI